MFSVFSSFGDVIDNFVVCEGLKYREDVGWVVVVFGLVSVCVLRWYLFVVWVIKEFLEKFDFDVIIWIVLLLNFVEC